MSKTAFMLAFTVEAVLTEHAPFFLNRGKKMYSQSLEHNDKPFEDF